MGKTIDEQVLKGRSLAEGLKANIEELKEKGVTPEAVEKLVEIYLTTEKLGTEQDKIKEEYHAKTAEVNAAMLELKNSILTLKALIKPYYTQDQWLKFGITDKK